MPAELSNPTLWMIIAAGVAMVVLAGRFRPLRVLMNLAITAALIGALVLAVGQRERLDPYFGGLISKLGISGQQVVGQEVRVKMAPDGHFWIRANIDGHEQRLLVDSGATVTALSDRTAARAGLTLRTEPYPMILQTANGPVTPQTARIAELRFGNIVARELPVVVSPAFGDVNVLGMNFLSRLKGWRVEGRTLILTPHNPQDVDNS